MENMRVRQYLGEKYLSGSADSTFKKITLDVPHLPPENIKNAQNQLTTKEVVCNSFLSVGTSSYYSCVSCNRKVQFRLDSVMLKCTSSSCSAKFLVKNSSKTVTARASLKKDDQIIWYSLFTPVLESFVQNHNEKHQTNEVLKDIDEDKLSEILLLSEGLKLRVNDNNNIVNSVTFT